MTFERLHQQSLSKIIGQERADRACLPTCFYILARAHGYLKDVTFGDFSKKLDWSESYQPDLGWIRSRLSHELRGDYKLPVVSWKLSHEVDIEKMVATGYVETQREITWFERNVADWPIEVIVAAGTPVIVTMKPGFGANKSVHAIILAQLKDDRYEVIDPDERNSKRFYTIDEIRRHMSPVGAGSVILPRT